MAEVLGSLPATRGADNDPAEEVHASTLAESGQGPCSVEEAEALIEKAIDAAETFYDTINEIIRRQAWVPLGYANPADLMLRKLGNTTINPSTGKPYSRAHVHRMSRVAWMLWAISSRTGVDPGELSIPERTLRDLPGGARGDSELVDQIERRVADAAADGNASPDSVQDVIDSAVAEALGMGLDDEDFDGPFDGPLQSIRGDGGESTGEGGRRDGAGSSTRGDDDGFEDDDTVDGREGREGPATPAYSAFRDDGYDDADDDDAPVTDATSALSQMRESANFTRTLTDIEQVTQQLSTLLAVKAKLPEFLDIIDDDELDSFKAKLVASRESLEQLPKLLEAIAATVEEVDLRLEEM